MLDADARHQSLEGRTPTPDPYDASRCHLGIVRGELAVDLHVAGTGELDRVIATFVTIELHVFIADRSTLLGIGDLGSRRTADKDRGGGVIETLPSPLKRTVEMFDGNGHG